MKINQQNRPNASSSRDAGGNRPKCQEKALRAHQSHFHPIFPSPLQKTVILAGCLLMACQAAAQAKPANSSQPLSDAPDALLLAQASRQYLVYVDGESAALLDQVRAVVPEAYVSSYKGRSVIQAGVFYDRELARRREKEIESLYIEAKIDRIADRERTTSFSPSPVGSSLASANRYLVVIPAPFKDLQSIAEQVRVLGAPAEGVRDRDKPRGYHVAVGPFADRSTADRWTRYLTDLGLGNARVYYGR